MAWGFWNKIKKGLSSAPKIGKSGNFAHGIVDTISKGPSMRELQLLHSNVDSDDDYPESGGMIKPLYK